MRTLHCKSMHEVLPEYNGFINLGPLTTLGHSKASEMLEPLVGERGASVPASVLAAALEAWVKPWSLKASFKAFLSLKYLRI